MTSVILDVFLNMRIKRADLDEAPSFVPPVLLVVNVKK